MPIYKIQTRRDTHDEWASSSVQLASGEMALNTTDSSNGAINFGADIVKPVLKIGDGSKTWSALKYAFAPGTCTTNGDTSTNYASKANPHFTGVAKAPAILVEAAASAVKLEVDATDGGKSVLTHDTLTTTNVGTTGSMITASHITTLNVGNDSVDGTLLVGTAANDGVANLTNAVTTIKTTAQSGLESTHTEAANAFWVRTNTSQAKTAVGGSGTPSGGEFASPTAGDMFFRIPD